ncbi:hypothetical protein [Roseococcus sp. SYP-B2431]|uniref:hypothetical protein n=1 Tax=Roseococcus sp. SYP-B2431 TaxID=2496640 RepID=UPI0013F3B8A2|nr:hypothetical protein [Roseococcus sp. SYP-B2431]
MLAFARPMKLHTPNGTIFAQYAMVPKRRGEPWWVMYRGEDGSWFTTMVDRSQMPA